MICILMRVLVLAAVLIASLSFSTDALADSFYEDPKGRFSMTYVGDRKKQVDGSGKQWFDYADLALSMTVVAVETGELAEGIARGQRAMGLDPEKLVESGRTIRNKWLFVSFYLCSDQGVTVLAQSREDATVVIVGRGQRVLTNNPPQDVLASVESLRLAVAEDLPETILRLCQSKTDLRRVGRMPSFAG